MMEALYWWDEAMKFLDQAQTADDPRERAEFIELASICEDLAAAVEERASPG
jgi:hypothetical protein